MSALYDYCICFREQKRKSSIKDFLEKEKGGRFVFSEVVSEDLDLLLATQDGSRVTGVVAGRDRRRCASSRSPRRARHFQRVRMANRTGPPAVLSKVHPWGFPWLKASDKKVCEEANSLIMFAFAVMEAASKALQRGHRIAQWCWSIQPGDACFGLSAGTPSRDREESGMEHICFPTV